MILNRVDSINIWTESKRYTCNQPGVTVSGCFVPRQGSTFWNVHSYHYVLERVRNCKPVYLIRREKNIFTKTPNNANSVFARVYLFQDCPQRYTAKGDGWYRPK